MNRLKLYVEYPLAKTIQEAIEFIENGGGVWQEDSNDFPSCGGFDDVEELKANFPKEDWDYNEDNQHSYLHLVPDKEEEAKPFKVGETVWAMEKINIGTYNSINNGETHKITKIRDDLQYLALDGLEDRWFPYDMFCRCVLPVDIEKVYILADMNGDSPAYDFSGVYKHLDFLKEECGRDILWSDEYDDFELELGLLGIVAEYVCSNWDIEGINSKTGKLMYGIDKNELRTQS